MIYKNYIFALVTIFVMFLFVVNVSGLDLNATCNYDINTCDLNDLNTYSTNPDFNFVVSSGIPVYFFYSPNCIHCKNVENYFQSISKDYNLNVKAINRDGTKYELNFFTKVLNDFNSNNFGVPALVINNHIYYGDSEIIKNLPKELEEYKLNKYDFYVPKDTKKPVNFLTVTGLAFADSVNPCELVVLLILLSSVLMKFNSKKKVFQYGLAFIITIYVMYFLIGVVAIFGFKLLGSFVSSSVLYIIFGAIALILGLLNLKDAISYGAGNFVMEVPRSWRPTMKKLLESVSSVWSAIVIAIILAVFLLPCTAGPYVLITGLLAGYSWGIALLWLVYYNFIFSLPMWIILFVVYFGLVKIDTLQRTRDKNIKNLHLVASILLILLGLYLFWLVLF